MSVKAEGIEELVPLGQTGISEGDILRQVETLCHSTAFEKRRNAKKLLKYLVSQALIGRVPRVGEIAAAVLGKRNLDRGDAQVRTETGKLRRHLAQHYASVEAKRDEIRFNIPPRQYIVFAPRMPAGDPGSRTPGHSGSRMLAAILEPQDKAQVYQRVTVRGRIDRLHPDLRAWLVVETPVGDNYPQCRVSRSGPEWEHDVRIGLVQWASDEGARYIIHLVATDADGDFEFYRYLKSGRDGFGPLLPTDSRIVDSKHVTRRDIRPDTQSA
jgi:hypothetical protein